MFQNVSTAESKSIQAKFVELKMLFIDQSNTYLRSACAQCVELHVRQLDLVTRMQKVLQLAA
jgi:hypothetical protein